MPWGLGLKSVETMLRDYRICGVHRIFRAQGLLGLGFTGSYVAD